MTKKGRKDWEAIFHGSRRAINTMIIGSEADFHRQKRFSHDERARLMQGLKDYVSLSYEGNAAIAAEMGVSADALNGWLSGKVKPTFKSLAKLREFLDKQPEAPRGIAPIGYRPIVGNNLNGKRGKTPRFRSRGG